MLKKKKKKHRVSVQMIPSEQVFHQEEQLSAPDGKNEGNEIRHGKQTRRSISLQTVFSKVDHPCKLSQTNFFFHSCLRVVYI